MYTLKEKTKEMIRYSIGMSVEKFINLDFDEEVRYVNEHNSGICLFAPDEDDRIIRRGNPLLARNEFLTMDEVNGELSGRI